MSGGNDFARREAGALALAADMTALCEGHQPAQVLAAITSVLAAQVAALSATDRDAARLTSLVQARTMVGASDLIAMRDQPVH